MDLSNTSVSSCGYYQAWISNEPYTPLSRHEDGGMLARVTSEDVDRVNSGIGVTGCSSRRRRFTGFGVRIWEGGGWEGGGMFGMPGSDLMGGLVASAVFGAMMRLSVQWMI
jgi:hypothetical protein